MILRRLSRRTSYKELNLGSTEGCNRVKTSGGKYYSLFPAGFLVLLFLLFFTSCGPTDERQVAAFETRIEQLEDRLSKLEKIGDKVSKLSEKVKTLDQSQGPMALRVNQIVRDIASLREENVGKKHYHTVEAGETLSGIGRRYGLTVGRIRLLNEFAEGEFIYPGQQILVSP